MTSALDRVTDFALNLSAQEMPNSAKEAAAIMMLDTMGILIASGDVDFGVGFVGCFLGIALGDGALYVLGRVAGRRAMEWHWVHRFLKIDSPLSASPATFFFLGGIFSFLFINY